MVTGIDISDFQGSPDFAAVKRSGQVFVIDKATEGMSTIGGRDYQGERQRAQAAGLRVGAYHFAHPGRSARQQADFFYKAASPTHDDIPPALDLEHTDGLGPAALQDWASSFCERLNELDGRKPLFYSYTSFIRHEMGDPVDDFGADLWLAEYGPVAHTPRAWLDTGWTFWQFRSTARIPGIPGNCDQNYFHGTVADLDVLINGKSDKPPLVLRLMRAGFGERSAYQTVANLRAWDGLTVGTPLPTDSDTFRRLVDAGFGPDSARQVIYANRFAIQHPAGITPAND